MSYVPHKFIDQAYILENLHVVEEANQVVRISLSTVAKKGQIDQRMRSYQEKMRKSAEAIWKTMIQMEKIITFWQI